MEFEGVFPPGVKRPRHGADQSPSSNAEVKHGGVISPLPIRLHGSGQGQLYLYLEEIRASMS
jgi:hypothetical protein